MPNDFRKHLAKLFLFFFCSIKDSEWSLKLLNFLASPAITSIIAPYVSLFPFTRWLTLALMMESYRLKYFWGFGFIHARRNYFIRCPMQISLFTVEKLSHCCYHSSLLSLLWFQCVRQWHFKILTTVYNGRFFFNLSILLILNSLRHLTRRSYESIECVDRVIYFISTATFLCAFFEFALLQNVRA